MRKTFGQGSQRLRRLAARISFALMLAASPAAAAKAVQPNIIFILADDLGWGDTGFSWQNARAPGNPRIRTPNLDRLAASGVTLTDHYCAAPVCAPSRASILTGKPQGECSLRDNCFDRSFQETKTIGTVMRDAGYETWAVGKWGIAGGGESGQPVTSHPLDRGFDYYYGFLDHLAGHTYYHYRGHVNNAYMGITENRQDATDTAIGVYSTDLFTAKIKQLISGHTEKGNSAKPFFLYFAVNTIHGSSRCDDTLLHKDFLHVPGRPYPAEGVSWPLEKEPLETRNTWIDPQYADLPAPAARYATAITRFDNAFGDIMQHLEKCGIADDTIIIFTSDNGPANENGADPRIFDSVGPFDGMKRDVFEGGMRVPAVIRWPNVIKEGSVDSTPSQSHGWMDFLSAAANGKYEPMNTLVYTQYEFPWGSDTEAFREFAERKGAVRGLQQMVRLGEFVALRTRMREGDAKVRLYNVAKDPFQSNDLADDPVNKTILERLTDILDKRFKE